MYIYENFSAFFTIFHSQLAFFPLPSTSKQSTVFHVGCHGLSVLVSTSLSGTRLLSPGNPLATTTTTVPLPSFPIYFCSSRPV